MSKLNLSSKELAFIVIALDEYCENRSNCIECILFTPYGEHCKMISILKKLRNPAE